MIKQGTLDMDLLGQFKRYFCHPYRHLASGGNTHIWKFQPNPAIGLEVVVDSGIPTYNGGRPDQRHAGRIRVMLKTPREVITLYESRDLRVRLGNYSGFFERISRECSIAENVVAEYLDMVQEFEVITESIMPAWYGLPDEPACLGLFNVAID